MAHQVQTTTESKNKKHASLKEHTLDFEAATKRTATPKVPNWFLVQGSVSE